MIQYDAVKCAKTWRQRAVNELNLVVNARFEGTRFKSLTCDSETNLQHEYVYEKFGAPIRGTEARDTKLGSVAGLWAQPIWDSK